MTPFEQKMFDAFFPNKKDQAFGIARSRLLKAIAERLNKPASELKVWIDYDPIQVDEEAHHIANGSGSIRYTGD